MSSRSLNKVCLIGNLTRDPELRYTPSGTAVCTFGLATNRSWTTQTGEAREETEFHRIVAWNRLGELCAQLLQKGRKVYVEGRIATHTWTGQDGNQRTTTEIIIGDMILLDSRKAREESVSAATLPVAAQADVGEAVTESTTVVAETTVNGPTPASQSPQDDQAAAKKTAKKPSKSKQKGKKEEKEAEETAGSEKTESTAGSEDITPDDIPF